MYFKLQPVTLSAVVLLMILHDSLEIEPMRLGAERRTDLGEIRLPEENGEAVFEEDENMFHPVEMPSDFESYDIIVDGYITLEELADVTGAKENIHLAFNASDKDGDGKLSREEFQNAPWSLSFSNNESEESGSVEDEDEVINDEDVQIDPEIKRYLLTEEELKELKKARGYS